MIFTCVEISTIFLSIAAKEPPQPPANLCQPSPCGPNAVCRVVNGAPSCSCLPEFIGIPPGCKPECISNGECPSHQACINQKCRDPCPGSCGRNAECKTVSHTPICICVNDFTGDPFIQCNPRPSKFQTGKTSTTKNVILFFLLFILSLPYSSRRTACPIKSLPAVAVRRELYVSGSFRLGVLHLSA